MGQQWQAAAITKLLGVPEPSAPLATDPQLRCYASHAGCERAGLGPYHWCDLPKGQGEQQHWCGCGHEWPDGGM